MYTLVARPSLPLVCDHLQYAYCNYLKTGGGKGLGARLSYLLMQ